MHGCISCILNDVPFIGVGVTEVKQDHESTVKDLMRSFNLMEFYFSPYQDTPEKLVELGLKIQNEQWDHLAIAKTRSEFQNTAKAFRSKIHSILR